MRLRDEGRVDRDAVGRIATDRHRRFRPDAIFDVGLIGALPDQRQPPHFVVTVVDRPHGCSTPSSLTETTTERPSPFDTATSTGGVVAACAYRLDPPDPSESRQLKMSSTTAFSGTASTRCAPRIRATFIRRMATASAMA